MVCGNCGDTVPADEIAIEALERVEGASDPADMAAVVGFTCPHCSSRDLLILKYGPAASGAEAYVRAALPD